MPEITIHLREPQLPRTRGKPQGRRAATNPFLPYPYASPAA